MELKEWIMLKSILLLFLTIFIMLGCDSSESEPLQLDLHKPFTIYKGPINDTPVPINQKVYLEFSAPLNADTINDTTAYMIDENNNSVGLYIVIGNPDTKIILTPYTFLEPSTLYTIVVTTALQDIDGRSLSEEYRYEFTTQSDSVDSTPLTVRALKPDRDAPAVLVQCEIAIDFNKNLSLEPQYTDVEYLKVLNQAGAPIAGKIEVFNSILKFIPDESLPYEESITVSLENPVYDMFDNNFSDLALATWSFTTKTQDQSPKVNLGFAPFTTAMLAKHSYLVRKVYDHPTESKIAVATQDGIEIYLVQYSSSGVPTLLHLQSYSLASKINAMVSFSEEYLLVGTISDGIYTLKVDAAGVSEVGHYLNGKNIQGVSLGHGTTLDRAYGVGPLLGLQIFNLETTTGELTPLSVVESSLLGEALDVAEATEYDNNASANVRKIYVADYNGSVVVCDENGTILNRTDLNMSVKKLVFNEDYNGKLNLLAIGSSGKMQGLGFDGSLFSNVKLDLLTNIYDVKSLVDVDNLASSIYLSGGESGILVTSGDYPNHIVTTGGNVVSTAIVRNSEESLSYLVSLNEDGALKILNAFADVTSPYLSTTPYTEELVSSNGFNFTTTFFDTYLDKTTIAKESFVFFDLNNSVGVPFTLAIFGDEYKLTPLSPLSPNTTYSVTISGNVADLLGNQLNGGVDTVVTFKTNSDVPLVNITINDIDLMEDSNGSFVVSLNEASTTDISFDYDTVGGTAMDGFDYIAISGNATILAGELNTTILIKTKDDYEAEDLEYFTLVLTNPTQNAMLSDAEGLGSISDEVAGSEDTANIVISAPVSTHEGNAVTFTVATDKVALSDLKVDLEIQHIDTDSGDFNATSMSVIIGATNVNASVSIETIDDTTDEGDEVYKIVIVGIDSTLDGGYEKRVVSTSEVTTTIIDNDGTEPTYLDGAHGSGTENANIIFVFSIEEAIDSDITFNYATADNNATSGYDYTATSGSATIAEGETQTLVLVPLLDDSIVEGDETFYLNITDLSVNAFTEVPQLIGTILDDD